MGQIVITQRNLERALDEGLRSGFPCDGRPLPVSPWAAWRDFKQQEHAEFDQYITLVHTELSAADIGNGGNCVPDIAESVRVTSVELWEPTTPKAQAMQSLFVNLFQAPDDWECFVRKIPQFASETPPGCK